MKTSIYEQLGLSPNEAKIYQSLVETGEANISAIAVDANIHRRNAYDAIHRLVNKGLVFEIFSSRGSAYNAADPDKLTELLAEMSTELYLELPTLKKKFARRNAPEEAYIYKGHEGIKNLWRDILRVKDTVYIIGAKAQWLDSELKSARDAFFAALKKQNIKIHILFDAEIKKDFLNIDREMNFPKECRFLPKEYSTNSGINIFGSYVVTYTGISVQTIQEGTVIFVLNSTDLAESYRTWFKYMWEQSSP